MKRACILVAAVTLTAAVAAAKPNFSGDWKMNLDKTDYGPMPKPQSLSQKIDHQDPSLKVVITQVGARGEFTAESLYSTDGQETTNKMRNVESKSVAKWEGDVLEISTKANFQGNDVSIVDKWSLSEDGKTLTVKRHMASSMGEADATIVMEKQ